jgi:hypothetical protein
VVLRFNTEEIVMKESEDGSLKEFASVSLPRELRVALSKAVFEKRKLTVS